MIPKKIKADLILEATNFLQESFDSPHEKTEIFPNLNHEAMKHAGVSDYREYELGTDSKNGNLVSYKRKGSYEIHHTVGDISGKMIHSDKPNPRFVATMLHHAKGLIDAGHSVRIVGPTETGMFDHYHRIAKALARKHGYVTSTPKSYANSSDNPDAHKYSELTVLKECIITRGDNLGLLREFWELHTFSE